MAESTCSADDCTDPAGARGLCGKHYMRWWRTTIAPTRPDVPPEPSECAAPDCSTMLRVSNRSGYCTPHQGLRADRRKKRADSEQRRRDAKKAVRQKDSPTCAYDGCTTKLQDNNKSGYCRPHHKYSPMHWESLKAYWLRRDRSCGIPGCEVFARTHSAFCPPHENERTGRRRSKERASERGRLFEAQQGLCPGPDLGGCGLPMSLADDLHVDHIFPVVRGGSDDDLNKQLMHGFCNQSKHDKLVPALLKGPSTEAA